MTVYRHKGQAVWLFDFQHKRRRYHGSTATTNKRAAEAYERRIRDKIATGELGGVGDMLLDEAAERYWREHGQNLSGSASLEKSLATIVRLIGKDRTLGEINQSVIAEAVFKRSQETFARGKDRIVRGRLVAAKRYPVQPATVNRDIIAPLQGLLKLARTRWNENGQHGLPDISWRDLKLSEPSGLSRHYGEGERDRWLAAAAEKGADLDLALQMLFTWRPARRHELFFPLSAIDPEPGSATLTLKRERKRDVILHLPLRQDHARRLAARIGMAREAKLDTVWFERVGRRTVALTYHQVLGRLRAAAREAGVDGGRLLHGARHHAGGAMLAKTGNLKAVQKLLGHASITSSARYAHVLIDDLRDALEDGQTKRAAS